MTFKILSLDGGGTWALFEVMALIKIYNEKMRGHQVLQDFDMVAANSAGSLVLAGLVKDLSLGDILNYFMDEKNRQSLFQPTQYQYDPILELAGIAPKYSAAKKLIAIQELLGETGSIPLAGSMKGVHGPNQKPVHLLIVGFDYDRKCAVFFRSAPAQRGGWGQGQPSALKIAEAVDASTNAPVIYFDWPTVFPDSDSRYWDGGVSGCNNPCLVAVVEAVVLGRDPKEIRILSLGTGSDVRPPGPRTPYEIPYDTPGATTDLKKLSMAILDDPPDAASYIAHVMTGGNEGVPSPATSRVVRMSPLVCPLLDAQGHYVLPKDWNEDQFKYLCNDVDLAALPQNEANFLHAYAMTWLNDDAANQPIAANGAKFDPANPEIGYAIFSRALAAWRALAPPAVA